MFFWRDTHDNVALAFTDRTDGVSQGPYASLNLGGRVGDAPAAVAQNRATVARAVGVEPGQLVLMDQVHGAQVAVVDVAPSIAPQADAVITTAPGLALAALVADCTPVLLWDLAGPAVGAVHCGRPGLLAGVVPAAVAALRDVGAQRLAAVVGPSVCARCYEVPQDLREEVAAVAPAARAVSWTGTSALDIAAGVISQLADAGVELRTWVPGCSREDERLFSHRRSGTTGRFAGVIVRHAS